MHNKDFIDYYWDLITSHQFNEDIYDEMFRDEWLALTKHFTTFQRLVTAVKNRHNRLKEKAYLEQLEKEKVELEHRVLLLTRRNDKLQTTVGVRDLENANQKQQISVLQNNLATAPMVKSYLRLELIGV